MTAATVEPSIVNEVLYPALEQVTIVMVTFESAHCLLLQQETLAQIPHVMIVDNASHDGSPDTARACIPHAQVFCLNSNVGYGRACNVALDQVTTPFALLLNPDCQITPQAVATLVTQAQAQFTEAWIVVPQLLHPDGRKQINYSMPRHHFVPQTSGADGPISVGYACAAAMLLHMSGLRTIGFFDPSFFLYYEDEDLCLRVYQSRKDIVVDPSITAIHGARGSVAGKHPLRAEFGRGYHHAQSKLHFLNKHRIASVTLMRLRVGLGSIALLFVRLLLPSPKHLARAWGRFWGVLRYSEKPFIAPLQVSK